jgi:hypothetical protein
MTVTLLREVKVFSKIKMEKHQTFEKYLSEHVTLHLVKFILPEFENCWCEPDIGIQCGFSNMKIEFEI